MTVLGEGFFCVVLKGSFVFFVVDNLVVRLVVRLVVTVVFGRLIVGVFVVFGLDVVSSGADVVMASVNNIIYLL